MVGLKPVVCLLDGVDVLGGQSPSGFPLRTELRFPAREPGWQPGGGRGGDMARGANSVWDWAPDASSCDLGPTILIHWSLGLSVYLEGCGPGSALLFLLSYWGLGSTLPGLCRGFVLIQLTADASLMPRLS